MRVLHRLFPTLTLPILLGSLLSKTAFPVEINGRNYFVGQPRLVSASTTFNTVWAMSATYYFTITLPEDASVPLERVTINLKEGGDFPRFFLKETTAFVGKSRREQAKLTLGEVTRDEQTQTLSITFDPPVSPGKTITIALRPVYNPRYSGVYLFGVTAYPVGENSYGQFLGYGRLQFYETGDGIWSN